MSRCLLDHVSILVEAVDTAARLFADSGIAIGDKEIFGDTGTEEIYVGSNENQALLLLQAPTGAGPYRRALTKRGPGLHHLALATDDFNHTNDKLAALGWLVHPASLRNFKKGTTVYYVRPGVGIIIELITHKQLEPKPCLISGLLIQTAPGMEAYISGLGLTGVHASSSEAPCLEIHGKNWPIQVLTGPPTRENA